MDGAVSPALYKRRFPLGRFSGLNPDQRAVISEEETGGGFAVIAKRYCLTRRPRGKVDGQGRMKLGCCRGVKNARSVASTFFNCRLQRDGTERLLDGIKRIRRAPRYPYVEKNATTRARVQVLELFPRFNRHAHREKRSLAN